MGQLIELLGATVIGSLIILVILSLNLQMNETTRELTQNRFTQRFSAASVEILEYDLYKAGYNTSGNKILLADSNQIRFRADLDNNGTIDTVYYSTSSTSAMSSTNNPNDKQLLRRVNSTTNTAAIITRLLMVYYDSLGTLLTYANLANQSTRDKVKTIRTYLKLELPDAVNNYYNPVEVRRIIRPKNLF